jgi:hypothetical protein
MRNRRESPLRQVDVDERAASSPTIRLRSPKAVAKGTPVGSINLTGDDSLTGAASGLSVRCDFPDLDGESIAVLGTAFDSATSLRIGVLADKVTIRLYSTGADGQYQERAFAGSGVTEFDATNGATIDSPVTEAAPTKGAAAGSLGAITAIKGSLDCNEQQPGSSSLTFTGETVEGTLTSATLDHVRVECNRDPVGYEAVVLGILAIGSTKAFVSVGLRVDGLGVVETLASESQHKYQAPAGSATTTATGGHADGDAVEQEATPPHTIHVEGDVTCGAPATG